MDTVDERINAREGLMWRPPGLQTMLRFWLAGKGSTLMSGPFSQAGIRLQAPMDSLARSSSANRTQWFIFPIGFSSPRSNLLAIMQHALALLEEGFRNSSRDKGLF
jgi:hypothetical protein